MNVDEAVLKSNENKKKDFIISNDEMFSIKMIQNNPIDFEEKVMKAIADKPSVKSENSIKNK